MSGRRCSSSEGSPAGTRGVTIFGLGSAASAKPEAGTPTNTAIAWSSTARLATTSVSVASVESSWLRALATSSPEAIFAASRIVVMLTAWA